MVGTPVIGAFIAVWGFWVLLLIGIVRGEIGISGAAIFVSLWLTGLLGLPHVPYDPLRGMFSSWVAALDIALVFRIFKGDVRLT
jgi:hypothetical protein